MRIRERESQRERVREREREIVLLKSKIFGINFLDPVFGTLSLSHHQTPGQRTWYLQAVHSLPANVAALLGVFELDTELVLEVGL